MKLILFNLYDYLVTNRDEDTQLPCGKTAYQSEGKHRSVVINHDIIANTDRDTATIWKNPTVPAPSHL